MNDVNRKTAKRRRPSRRGEPTWEIARLFPRQGEWTEPEYLAVALGTNRVVELSNGYLEILPMALPYHQLIVFFLARALAAFVEAANLGMVLPAPLPIRLGARIFRDPDVVFLGKDRSQDLHKTPEEADLVMEVLSAGTANRERDLVAKRGEYARGGIREYWLVDPELFRITLLSLEGAEYRLHGEFEAGQQATSMLLVGFEVSVDKVFAAGPIPPAEAKS
jgi:Uma2 family endonuclease